MMQQFFTPIVFVSFSWSPQCTLTPVFQWTVDLELKYVMERRIDGIITFGSERHLSKLIYELIHFFLFMLQRHNTSTDQVG